MAAAPTTITTMVAVDPPPGHHLILELVAPSLETPANAMDNSKNVTSR